MQTMLFDRTIRVLHIQMLQSEQLALSFFLHVAKVVTDEKNLGGNLSVILESTEKCYATIEAFEEKKYVIDIKTEDQNNRKKSYRGTISLLQNGFFVSSFQSADYNTF